MFHKIFRLVIAIGCIAAPFSGNGSIVEPRFYEECVGRSRISLPADVEVAAMLPDDFKAELAAGVAQPAFRFSDGEFATSNAINYGGRLFVTHKISSTMLNDFRRFAVEMRDEAALLIEEEGVTKNETAQNIFEQLSNAHQIGTAWRINTDYIAYLDVGDHSVLWRSTGIRNGSTELLHDFHSVVRGLQPRAIFTIPKQEGVCLPNIFIADDRRTVRSVRTAFRMKSHPDLVILFEDTTAVVPSRGRKSPAESLINFWDQFEYRPTVRHVRSAWNLVKTRPVLLGKREAVASFVRITRDSGVVDYGYAAIAHGKPGAAIDTPDLKIYVIQDAALAGKKGIKPIGEKEFVWIVERIVKSVRNGAGG